VCGRVEWCRFWWRRLFWLFWLFGGFRLFRLVRCRLVGFVGFVWSRRLCGWWSQRFVGFVRDRGQLGSFWFLREFRFIGDFGRVGDFGIFGILGDIRSIGGGRCRNCWYCG
jgi:hypothetical protein